MRGYNLIYEFSLGGIYLIVILFLVHFYASTRREEVYTYFKWGLTLKLLGGYAFGFIYLFYYGYGDTFYYHECSLILRKIIVEDPVYGIKLVFNQVEYYRAQDYLYNEFLVNYFRGDDTFTVIKISGFISLFGLGGFFSTTALFSCFAFFGQWKLYQTFINKFPDQKFSLAIAHFLIPSVIFWGSGIMKDSLTLGFVGILFHYLDRVISRKQYKPLYFTIIFISTYFIFTIKGYVVLALLPAVLTWVFFKYAYSISNSFVKFIIVPLLIVTVIISSAYSFTLLENIDKKFSTNNLFKQVNVFQTNHYSTKSLDGTGSGYSLGEYESTFTGVLQQVIPAIVVTLYRPYPWEVNNPIMGLTALESLFFIFFTLYVLVKVRISEIYRIIGSNSFILMSLVFCIIFAFIVGFSSYNFGALARYKIPCLPFYSSILIVLLGEKK